MFFKKHINKLRTHAKKTLLQIIPKSLTKASQRSAGPIKVQKKKKLPITLQETISSSNFFKRHTLTLPQHLMMKILQLLDITC